MSGITFPAEWAPQQGMWLGFPSHPALWDEDYAAAQDEAAGLAQAIATTGATPVHVIVHDAAAEEAAQRRLKGAAGISIHILPLGDVWLRDTAPLMVQRDGALEAQLFRVNGWGGKYLFEDDRDLAGRLARRFGFPSRSHNFVLEGGSIETDGTGTFLTTAECLANPNRNPQLSRDDMAGLLRESLGCARLIWIEEGLRFDHTDGHIDNLARFIAPGHVVCQHASGGDDPQRARLLHAEDALRAAGLVVSTVPSPGHVAGLEDAPLAASHMNFVIANKAVIVPLYGTRFDDAALHALRPLFPGREVLGRPALNILRLGGGSFHCMTQQIPS